MSQAQQTKYLKDIVEDGIIPFELAVSMGRIPGYSIVDKFGENAVIDTTTDPEDIWEGGGLYNYDAVGTAPIVSLISTDNGDNQPIKVTGLDITGAEVEQTITLTGTTRVALTTPLWRVYRLENEGTTSLAGTCYCYVGTGGVPVIGDTRALIDNGNNQTQMGLYTIPLGKVGFLFRGELGVNFQGGGPSANDYARCQYYSRRVGKVFKIKKTISLTVGGSSIFQDRRSFPDIVPALTDIKLTAEEVSNTMGAWAAFDILLVDEDKLDASFISAIAQPLSMPS